MLSCCTPGSDYLGPHSARGGREDTILHGSTSTASQCATSKGAHEVQTESACTRTCCSRWTLASAGLRLKTSMKSPTACIPRHIVASTSVDNHRPSADSCLCLRVYIRLDRSIRSNWTKVLLQHETGASALSKQRDRWQVCPQPLFGIIAVIVVVALSQVRRCNYSPSCNVHKHRAVQPATSVRMP